MIVYADREQTIETRALLHQIRQAGDPQERLILEGQLESGVVDALCPEFDKEIDLCGVALPDQISIRKPEGYAFYSLYPELYRDAALRFLNEKAPAACVVVGIRSIGTSLSRVVAETVHAQWRFTVRPRGHPFHRELRLDADLAARVRCMAADTWFLIVDEGPGLSGSSFTSVASGLEQLGVPAERIALFPSHNPNPDNFVSEHSRKNWRRYDSYVEPFRSEQFVPPTAQDISSGAWRSYLYPSEADYPPIHSQHERRKYLEGSRLWKFSGLGHFGRAKFERAARLTEFCPLPLDFHNGFLVTEWMEARPAERTSALLDTMAEYLAFLRAEFATNLPIPAGALAEMIERNTGQRISVRTEGVVVAGDSRMLRQEWLETPKGYIKADALDHHDDHFFPGCQDIAWDIAGAIVEWDLPEYALIDRYLRLRQDPTLLARLPFYITAYKAYRFGYCHLAAETLGDSEDGLRFRRWLPRYASPVNS